MRERIVIKKAEEKDVSRMAQLFSDTLYRVNSKDYTPEQIEAWNNKADEARWNFLFNSSLQFLLAENEEGNLLGFTSINMQGYLHSMFVHADYQGRGIAGILLEEAEAFVSKQRTHISAEVSITACPFFLKKGFVILKEQEVEINGVTMKNYLMEKDIRNREAI